jgi:hypothetical protein
MEYGIKQLSSDYREQLRQQVINTNFLQNYQKGALEEFRKIKENLDLIRQQESLIKRDESILSRNAELQGLDFEAKKKETQQIIEANKKVINGTQIQQSEKLSQIQKTRRDNLSRLNLLSGE